MSAHTKGPWFVKATNGGGFEILDMPDCWDAAVLCARNPWEEQREEMAANARLIAAAPELLAALVESQESIGGDWRERRDALILKATGGQP